MVWTPHQVITRLRPPRHTASTPRRPADQLDTSPLWFWDDEPRTTPRTDTLPIIIDQDGDPYPPVERTPGCGATETPCLRRVVRIALGQPRSCPHATR